jgi:hypothetical protein
MRKIAVVFDNFKDKKKRRKEMPTGIDAFQFRDVVRDTVTGFTGVVVARTEWLNGCVRMLVQPQELKDSRPIEADWVDVQQLELVHAGPKTEVSPAGGPQKDPKSPVG